MTEAPKPGRYRHYKRNNEYTVIAVVTRDSAPINLELRV